MQMMTRQTWALFVDAYRDLNSKKLFWLVLALSALVCLAMLALGLNEKGLKILWYQTGLMPQADGDAKRDFYVGVMFYGIGFKVWLSFFAAALALVSTAGLFPDFIQSGSIDLALTKPMSRSRLFFTKWLTGMLFVFLQITLFAVGSIFAIGLRGGSWNWSILWAIPLTMLFFSYLFSFCVLVGVLTRSTIAALLLTVLLWGFVWLLHWVAMAMPYQQMPKADYAVRVLEQRGMEGLGTYERMNMFDPETIGQERGESTQEDYDEALADAKSTEATWKRFYWIAYGVETALPNFSDTTDIVGKKLFPDRFSDERLESQRQDIEFSTGVVFDPAILRETYEDYEGLRGGWWSIGSSLVFEFFVLGLAWVIFVRRDY